MELPNSACYGRCMTLKPSPVIVRTAQRDDASALLRLTRALAEYEGISPDVVFTEAVIAQRLLSDTRTATALLAEVDSVPVGFAIYYGMSTFFNIRWMVMEALFVDPSARHRGIGRRLMQALAAKAVADGCARMEWSVMAGNPSAIAFYASIGENPSDGIKTYRASSETLKRMAKHHEA